MLDTPILRFFSGTEKRYLWSMYMQYLGADIEYGSVVTAIAEKAGKSQMSRGHRAIPSFSRPSSQYTLGSAQQAPAFRPVPTLTMNVQARYSALYKQSGPSQTEAQSYINIS